MASNANGLGKGLAALLGDNVMDNQEEKASLYLPISQVESCAGQPRKQLIPIPWRTWRTLSASMASSSL